MRTIRSMRILPAIETNVITIEKNIPIPDRNHYNAVSKYSFVHNMEVGESFKINGNTPDFNPKRVRQYMYNLNAKKSLAMRFTVHTIDGTGRKPKAIRVWRIK